MQTYQRFHQLYRPHPPMFQPIQYSAQFHLGLSKENTFHLKLLYVSVNCFSAISICRSNCNLLTMGGGGGFHLLFLPPI